MNPSPATQPGPTGRRTKPPDGFSLVELIVALALVGVLSGLGWAMWRQPLAPAREGALALLQAQIAAARAEAALLGAESALLVCVASDRPEDFLRRLVRARRIATGWEPVDRGLVLANGVFLLPPDGPTGAGGGVTGATVERPSEWVDADGDLLRSTALRPWPDAGGEILGTRAWLALKFSPQGTTAGGDVWIASGRIVPAPAATVRGEHPESAVGLTVSRYGAVSGLASRLDR